MFTRSSVVCAERIVAVSSSYALPCVSAHCTSGYSSPSRRTTSAARVFAPRGRAIGCNLATDYGRAVVIGVGGGVVFPPHDDDTPAAYAHVVPPDNDAPRRWS